MKAARILTPVLAGATLLLLGANALPTIRRKHRLEIEKVHIQRELAHERRRQQDLRARVHAIRHDRFFLQRLLAETWHGRPAGAVPFEPEKKVD